MTVFLVGTVVFSACEIIVRLFRPQFTYSKILLLTGEQYEASDIIPFTLKKNYVAQSPSQEYPGKMVEILTNSYGLRGPETAIDKDQSTKRILVLGDSYTFGVYCEENEVYPRILERLYINENKDTNVEVLNAGYTDGWSPDEHYAWLVKRGVKFKPDLIVYGFFIGNDIGEIKPLNWRDIDEYGLPTKCINPNIYIDGYGRIRSKVSDVKTEGVHLIYQIPILRESHFLICLNRVISANYNSLMKSSSTRAKRVSKGWGERPFDFILEESPSDENKVKEKLFIKLVQGMSDVAKEVNSRFIILMIPVNFQVEPDIFLEKVLASKEFGIKRDYFKELEPKLERRGIQYINILEEMRRHPEVKYFPRNGEVHFNPNGHKFTALKLKNKLDELGWF